VDNKENTSVENKIKSRPLALKPTLCSASQGRGAVT
jgi:hypothetical protein